ncbi:MAG: metallophosphoesterase [Candidatus Thorarchaeota archaeon]
MKILFFSDLHQDHYAISDITRQLHHVDIAFGLGDFANFGRGLIETLETLDIGTELYFVPGNHDNADELKWICGEHECFKYFHGKHEMINSNTFAGLGGGLPGVPFGVTEQEVRQILERFNNLDNLVLCTHTPPFGTNVDLTLSGSHIGYQRLREFILEVQPLAVYSGHVHEAEKKMDHLGSTQLFAVGPKGLICEL